MKINILKAFLSLFLLIFLCTCKKDKAYPPCTSCVSCASSGSKPAIEYLSNQVYVNDSLILSIKFCDKEGDVGLSNSDTTGIFVQGNVWMTYYFRDSTGNWSAYDTEQSTPQMDTFKISYLIPLLPAPPVPAQLVVGGNPYPVTVYLEPGQILQGVIKFNLAPFVTPHAEVKYDIYVYDKAMNKSNVITTPSIFP